MNSNDKNMFEVEKCYNQGDINKHEYIAKMYDIHSVLFSYIEYIKTTDISKIEIKDDQVIMTTRENEVSLICDTTDMRTITTEILNFKNYEKELLDFMKKLINEEDTIFDIGANIGWYSLNLGKIFSKNSIHCFEPIQKTYNILKSNVAINNRTNITHYNIGFSEKSGKHEMYYPKCASGNASLKDLTGEDGVTTFICEMQKMDDFVEENKLKVDFIKCDVEGAELLVIKGAYETLKRDNPIIFIEMLRKWSAKFNYHPNEIIKMLQDIGYRCFVIDKDKLNEFKEMNESTQETNFIFLHNKRHLETINKFI